MTLEPFNQFWRAEEKRLSKLVAALDPSTVEALVARAFWLKAREQVVLLGELATAWEWCAWAFYRSRAEHLASLFGILLYD